ncbi:MAG: type II toxin-antitoxin system VapC family toxin [bacterium]|nr:type II toxin-antitoxin system VapC family toxin [bacterium]
MIRWLFDTDHVSLNERGHPFVRQWLAAVHSDSVGISVITAEEMIRGRLAILARRSAGEARVHAYRKFLETVQFCATISVVPFDSYCETKFQELLGQRLRVGSQDLRIASTAPVHNLILVTRNRKDFERVPGLTIEDWSAGPPLKKP